MSSQAPFPTLAPSLFVSPQISRQDILAAAAMHIYETEPSGKLSQLFAIEGIPPTYQLIKPIAEEANQLAAANDAEADDFLKFVTAVISLLDKASEKAIELGLSEAVPPTIQ